MPCSFSGEKGAGMEGLNAPRGTMYRNASDARVHIYVVGIRAVREVELLPQFFLGRLD